MRWSLVLVGVFLVAAVFLALSTDAGRGGAPDVQIGVVLYGSGDSARWDTLEQGIRQACRELDIESPVISAVAPAGSMGQERLILQEVDAGIDGLLLAPEDSEAMRSLLDERALHIPVVLLKSEVTGLAFVGGDDAGMAKLLADSLAGIPGDVAVLAGSTRRQNVQLRQDVFLREMARQGHRVTVLEEAPSPWPHAGPMQGIVVALDTETLDLAIQARAEVTWDGASLYGIGSKNSIVHALNQGTVDGIVFQNEYAIGYIAMMRLAARLGLAAAPADAPIQYRYVGRETMYEPDAERLLFPIVQ